MERMETEVIHGSIVFSRLASEWDELADRSMTSTPFQTLAYQRAWWSNLGRGNLHTVAVRDSSGRLAGLASFYIFDKRISFNGCIEETDYLDLIAPAEDVPLIWDHVFDVLERDDFPAWQSLDLCNVPAVSRSNEILQHQAAKHGYKFRSGVQEVCPVINLPSTYDAYLMSLDKKQRHEIRRKLRRADGAGLELVTTGPEEDIFKAVDDFLILLQKSMPEKEEWLSDGRRKFFHQVAKAAFAAGTLRLMFLNYKGTKAAALFCFDHKNRILLYNSGFDIEKFGHLSPGIVLTAGAIKKAIENGREAFDFLRGDEVYKYRFGARDTMIHRLQIEKS